MNSELHLNTKKYKLLKYDAIYVNKHKTELVINMKQCA